MAGLTELGKMLRKMRIDHGERLLDMARKLDMSPAFLSSIEMGRKAPPLDFEAKVAKLYGLDKATERELRSAARKQRREIRFRPKTDLQMDTVELMARKLDVLTDDDLRAIQRILRREED